MEITLPQNLNGNIEVKGLSSVKGKKILQIFSLGDEVMALDGEGILLILRLNTDNPP